MKAEQNALTITTENITEVKISAERAIHMEEAADQDTKTAARVNIAPPTKPC